MRILTLFFSFLISTFFAQDIQFAWMKGGNVANQQGIYGTLNVSDVANTPGARENAMSWVDQAGNFWLFGGHGLANSSTEDYLNDLWKFDTKTNQWTWVSGSNTTNAKGVYGNKNQFSASNVPGARQNGYTWLDQQGNLWLFGGFGNGVKSGAANLNDLWQFNITDLQWRWVSGSNTTNATAVYGTKNVADGANVPGSRFGGNAWVDKDGNLWLFGGQENHGTVARLNDLWKYTISDNKWTWISGSNQVDQLGVYGNKGVASSSNSPGARQASVSWTDTQGNFWIFGGYGFPSSGTSHSYLNDLWKFDPTKKEWTWVSGSDQLNQAGNYGTKGVLNANTVPGARQMSIGWVDESNNLWMFGCWGYNGPHFGRMNDLWKFSISDNQWAWMSGNASINTGGVYGQQSMLSSNNLPGARRMSVSFKDLNGDFWLFGGNGYDKIDTLGVLNDLWKISFDAQTNSISENKNAIHFSIYPTVVDNELNIQSNSTFFSDHEVVIFDYLGRNVFQSSFNETKKIDLKEWTPGIYLVEIDLTVFRIVKQ